MVIRGAPQRLARQAVPVRLLALLLVLLPTAAALPFAQGGKSAAATQACPVISGYVYYDVNDNGRMDTGEPGLPGVPMQLKDAAGATVALASTASSGEYLFDRPLSSSSGSRTQTHTGTFDDSVTDWRAEHTIPQFDASLGTLESVSFTLDASITSSFRAENLDPGPQDLVAEGGGAVSVDAPGISITAAPVLAARLFAATGYDGAVDFAGTSGLDFGPATASDSATGTISAPASLAAYAGGGTVAITAVALSTSRITSRGDVVDEVDSTASARVTVVYGYRPADCLPGGTYTVVEVTQPAGYGDGFETAGNGGPLPGTKGSDAIAVTLAGQGSAQNNFGELAASLQGCVYVDANQNGILDSGEPGIPGVTITLNGASSGTQLTGGDGCYLFTNLRPGVYTLTETQPAGFADCTDSIGTQGGATGNDTLANIRLPANVSGRSNNFGECHAAPVTAASTAEENETPAATHTSAAAVPGDATPAVANQSDNQGTATVSPTPSLEAATVAPTTAAPEAPDAGSGFFDRTPDVRFVILGFAIFAASGWIAFLALGRARDQQDR